MTPAEIRVDLDRLRMAAWLVRSVRFDAIAARLEEVGAVAPFFAPDWYVEHADDLSGVRALLDAARPLGEHAQTMRAPAGVVVTPEHEEGS